MAVTLSQFADYVRIGQAAAEYADLPGVLDAAVVLVEARVGARGVTGTYKVRPGAGGSLVLPLVNLTAVVSVTDPTGASVTVADCDVDLAAGVVGLPSVVRDGIREAYTVQVSTAASAAVDEATLIIGKHLLETRRGNRGQAANAYAADFENPSGFALPRRAAELLDAVAAPGFA